MAEPFGVPAGRVSSEVPGAHPGGPRPIPPTADSSTEAGDEESDASGGNGVGEPEAEAETEAQAEAEPPEAVTTPTAVAIGEGEELIELSDEEKAAVPTRSDDA
jgi:hypothetical protein